MGDRANVIVLQGNGDPPVVVYSHWGGFSLREEGKLDLAIEHARPRAGDPHYFTAMFIQAVNTQGLLSGVGTSLDDNEHPIMVVDAITGERQQDMAQKVADDFLAQWKLALK